MKLSQIGEFGLIEIIKQSERKRADTLIGIGDDAAVMRMSNFQCPISNEGIASRFFKDKKYLLATTDALVQDVHFKLKKKESPQTFFNLGYKALASNISDIAAMGGVPTHALITVALPKNLELESIQQLYNGIDSLAKKYGIDIIGGDTVSSPKSLMISITLLGEVERENLLLRSGAKPGDLICVTGGFGKPASNNWKLDIGNWKLDIRLPDARKLATAKICSSMIDSSDGLARSVIELCKSSKTSAKIFTDNVPRVKNATLDQALYGGEEYELVFTLPENKLNKLPKNLKAKITVVGEILKKQDPMVQLIDSHGKIVKSKGGFEHFK